MTAITTSHDYVKRLKLVDQVYRLMEQQRRYLDATFCIKHLARELGTNRSYASALFRSEIGMSFVDFVNGFRLQEAECLLRTTTLPAVKIAKQVGFGSVLSFRRAFEKRNAMTPIAYRAMYAQ